jgi:hydroxymethylglutaryl-CoA reductase
MTKKSSRIRGFYKKTRSQRLDLIKDFSALSGDDINLLEKMDKFDFDVADRMVENVVSVMPIPLGVAPNFLINKKNYFVPMAIEESSVVAAASYAAKLARFSGGFFSYASEPIMAVQIQLKNVPDVEVAIRSIKKHKKRLLEFANNCDRVLIEVGGGARDIECRVLNSSRGKMLILHLLVDVQDAMGANIVNRMGETITPLLEKITAGTAGVRIVSNLSTHRMVKSRAVWKKEIIGEKTIEDILDAYELALIDPFRCATHNKGIMNGIDAVAVATGNDFRAIEAGVHAYAAMNGKYEPLTKYHKDKSGDLVGELKIPLAAAVVGGVTQSHPVAKVSLKILGAKSACELSEVMGAVGLAQNFAALRALSSEGISAGHMRLHSKNIAVAAGAKKEFINAIAQQMVDEDNISVSRARELVEKMVL